MAGVTRPTLSSHLQYQFTQPKALAELLYIAAVHGESAGAVVEVSAKEK